jgi:hypothetical protein
MGGRRMEGGVRPRFRDGFGFAGIEKPCRIV